MDWNLIESDCPYDPDGPFGKLIEKLCEMTDLVSQDDIDVLEDMARAHQRVARELDMGKRYGISPSE